MLSLALEVDPGSAQTAAEHRSQHLRIAVDGVARRKDERDTPGACAASQLGEPRSPSGKLTQVAAAELLEPSRIVAIPAAQWIARSQVSSPLIDAGLLARESPRPEAVDENAVAVCALGRLVHALQLDVHDAPAGLAGCRSALSDAFTARFKQSGYVSPAGRP
jgi:hypothetical protein